jgi:pyroglutamyl-peptidase
MKILVTGFEPFGGDGINPSREVITRLPAQLGDIRIFTGCLPVAYGEAERELMTLLRRYKPDGVLSLGVAAGRCAPELERVALNLDDAAMADNRGVVRSGDPVSPGGPAAYFTTLPLERIRSAFRERGIPLFVSLSAGAFLCNHIFYLLMEYANRSCPPLMAGFMHLPALPEQGCESRQRPTMSLSLQIEAVTLTLEAMGTGGA